MFFEAQQAPRIQYEMINSTIVEDVLHASVQCVSSSLSAVELETSSSELTELERSSSLRKHARLRNGRIFSLRINEN
jgi:hypothetical protein